MNYTVLWTPRAEQLLATVWTEAQDRAAVTSAASSIDSLLAETPESLGESRDGNARVAFVRPLGVEFEVYPVERLVHVLAVWPFR